MATRTSNYGLIKPEYDDNIDVQQLNDNMDVLDDTIKTVENNVTSNTTFINNVKGQLPNYVLKSGDSISGDLRFAGANIRTTTHDDFTIQHLSNNRIELTDDVINLVTHYGDTTNIVTIGSNGNLNFKGDDKLICNSSGNSLSIGSYGNGVVKCSLACNPDGIIYLNSGQGTIQSVVNGELRLKSPSGTNLAISDGGDAWLNGAMVCTDTYGSGTDTYGEWKWFQLSKYTMIMCLRVTNPNNAVDSVYINFPRPFDSTSYTVACSTRRTGDSADIRINGDYRGTVSECSATGLRIGRDNLVDTQIIIIGRYA